MCAKVFCDNEFLHGICNRFYRIFQVFMDKNVN